MTPREAEEHLARLHNIRRNLTGPEQDAQIWALGLAEQEHLRLKSENPDPDPARLVVDERLMMQRRGQGGWHPLKDPRPPYDFITGELLDP